MTSPNHNLPILYSYLHCPYCQRARAAIALADAPVRLREVKLPTKPQELLTTSPKGSVPVLVLPDGKVIDESLHIMEWAIARNDPMGLGHHHAPESEINALIEENDSRFAKALIRLKHPERFTDETGVTNWPEVAEQFLDKLEARLTHARYLAGGHVTKVDIAIAPFVAQYVQHRQDILASNRFHHLSAWVHEFLNGHLYPQIMQEFPAWISGVEEPVFP